MKITFKDQGQKDFFTTLKKRVDEYFIENKLSKTGNACLYAKTALVLSIQIGLYLLLFSNHLNGFLLVIVFMLFGVATGLMTFITVHDALHGAYSSNPIVNKALGYLFDLNGASSYIWKLTHNVIHHTYTNIPGYDQDIDKAILLRLNPKDKLYSFHYYQNIYAFFLYSLLTANWVYYSDYSIVYEEYKKGKIHRKEISILLAFKLLNFILLIVLPLMYIDLPAWNILLGYFCGHLATGITISITFQLAHIVENVAYFEPDRNGCIENNWAIHEMLTTSNFETNNLVLTHLIGGLNFQVEHHLFPHISHIHYPAIQRIVKQTAMEFNLPYNENSSLTQALISHYKRIKRLGRQESLII